MCKIDLQDAYFSVSLNLKSKTFLSFKWKDLFYQFLCLCFSFRPAPRIFTKLMRVPISLLRKLYVRLLFFWTIFCWWLPRRRSWHLQGTLIYLLQNLVFLINSKNSVLEPCQNIAFLGIEVNSIEVTLTLPQDKKGKIVKQYQDLLGMSSVSIRS